ncbi:Delta(14)-sterol reductase [Endocarpon pusillum Z07020]|uniref:Delta(14)-sterol reductase n=1 Tax=Endocarpon pusillum (strain Z07020 / HMAS-L-300199) TaxID=1263415 RepID=U1HTS2_ENDPU|nr:Delta(14)-sterol reductase [Endocarpon pusillum Z07020]ERF72639.1 Delta(14)-sterol reductase [Endocarpon pusillum Z07020]
MARGPAKHKDAPAASAVEKHGYEFGGPLGAAAFIFGLPVLVYLSLFLCNDVSGCPAPSLLHPKSLTLARLKTETPWPKEGWSGLIDAKVTAWVLAYYGLSLAMQLILPGVESKGVKLDSGGQHSYKFNAFPSALLTLAALAVGTLSQGTSFPVWTFIWDKLPQIVTTNLIISYLLAIYVYLVSFSVPHPGQTNLSHRELAKGGRSGNMIYDFFIGRELNPRIDIPESIPVIGGQSIDIKLFCELRPGMLGWIILNLAFIAHQYREHGTVSDSILLITAFQMLYVLDALYMEPAILTTIDVTTDGFGFMLSFGDLVWLPFIYSLQARYLAVHPVHLGPAGIAGILAVQALGYYIFRASNNEKNRFRTDPKDPRVKHLQSIPTHNGSRLLTSGWWGRARHINYLGDWIMSWSYSLPTGIAGYLINKSKNPLTGNESREVVPGDARGWGMVFTYFYIIYFAILLIHRERRDEQKCRRKYGADWDKYTAKVKSRIVPGIY